MADAKQSRIKELIARGKEQGYLTYAEVNDHLPEDISDPDQVEDIIQMINDMGIKVFETAPDADALLLAHLPLRARVDHALPRVRGRRRRHTHERLRAVDRRAHAADRARRHLRPRQHRRRRRRSPRRRRHHRPRAWQASRRQTRARARGWALEHRPKRKALGRLASSHARGQAIQQPLRHDIVHVSDS